MSILVLWFLKCGCSLLPSPVWPLPIPFFMDLTFQVPMQYCSLQHQTLLSSSDTSTTGHYFHCGSASSFLLELFFCSSPVAYWPPTNLGSSSFSVTSFCLFILNILGNYLLFFTPDSKGEWALFQKVWALSLFSYSVVSQFIATPWTAARQTSLSFTISLNLLKLKSIESVMPSNPLILCHPLLLLLSAFPSIRVFSNDLALCIRWPKYWSFSISPSSEYSELISFRID